MPFGVLVQVQSRAPTKKSPRLIFCFYIKNAPELGAILFEIFLLGCDYHLSPFVMIMIGLRSFSRFSSCSVALSLTPRASASSIAAVRVVLL